MILHGSYSELQLSSQLEFYEQEPSEKVLHRQVLSGSIGNNNRSKKQFYFLFYLFINCPQDNVDKFSVSAFHINLPKQGVHIVFNAKNTYCIFTYFFSLYVQDKQEQSNSQLVNNTSVRTLRFRLGRLFFDLNEIEHEGMIDLKCKESHPPPPTFPWYNEP